MRDKRACTPQPRRSFVEAIACYVWGVECADPYPGVIYIDNSDRAAGRSDLVGHEMHEVQIESNALDLILIFHDLRIDRLAIGDRDIGPLTPLD